MSDAQVSIDPQQAIALAVEVVVFTTRGSALEVLVVRRGSGRPRLPGALVGVNEELDRAAVRALRSELGLEAPVRQFHAFGGVTRDPSMRIISIGYMAVAPLREIEPILNEERELASVGPAGLRSRTGRKLTLALDHGAIVEEAVRDLRLNLDHTRFAFGLVAREFSLRELQEVHEAIRGRPLNKPAFRKRLLESGWLESTGRRETDKGFRPAELYRARSEPRR